MMKWSKASSYKSLETLHFTQALRKKVDAFHLRGLQKIVKLSTTFVDRRNTIASVYELPLVRRSQMILPDLFGELDWQGTYYARAKFRPSPEPAHVGKCRFGHTRQQWLFRTNEAAIRNRISHAQYEGAPFQSTNILRAARQRVIWFSMTSYQAPKRFFWLRECNEVRGKRKNLSTFRSHRSLLNSLFNLVQWHRPAFHRFL